MLRLLSERQNGVTSPLLLRRAQTARRHFDLELSKDTEVEDSHTGGINSLDLDVAENRYLLSGGSDSIIAIHDTQGKGVLPKVCQVKASHFKSVETVQWYPVDTGLFTSSGADCQLKVWDTNRMKVVDTFTFSDLVHCHHMSPVARKHSLVAVGAGRCTVKLVDVRSGSASHQLKGHKASVLSVQWSSRHEFLLASGGLDKKVILWDVRKSKGELMMLDQHRDRQAGSSRCDKTAHNHTINSIHFTPDGLHLVTYGTDHQLHLWDTSFGDLLPVNYGVVENTVKKALQMEVVADCSPALLFVPSDSTIRLYDLFKGEQLTTLSGHYYNVNCCVSHPDSQFLFSGGKDHNLLVWTPHVERDQQDGASSSPKTPGGSAAVTADAWSSDEET